MIDADHSWSGVVRQCLAKRQHGLALGRHLSPRLAYGRHRGPARLGCRHAAVVIAIYPNEDTGEPCFALTRRPMTLSHHAGQICLPGGRIEPGEIPLEAAVREYQEELGVDLQGAEFLGTLPQIYVYASDNLVDTCVLLQREKLTKWQPDPSEVDEVIEISVASMASLGRTFSRSTDDPQVRTISSMRRGKVAAGEGVLQYRFSYPALQLMDCGGQHRQIWGATAMLLADWSEIAVQAERKN